MRSKKTKGILLPVILGILLALPMWALANDTEVNSNLEAVKLLRQAQNQSIQQNNMKANSVQVKPNAEQARMLRLNKALSRITGPQPPLANHGFELNPGGSSLQAPQTERTALREVMFGHGALANRNDSLYFNFLTGMNSADSIGMDVRITGNEGTNFGNEGASWGDPSLLYWIAPLGNLENVPMVASIDDPEWTWTTISWDWTGGNNGQPLAVGNLWGIYARTSHMYVALEVTYVEPWNQYFEFDYIIQTNGSNMFDGEPSMLDMTVNGMYGDTLVVGSNPYFEIQLGNEPFGQVMVFWDANHNGDYDDGEDAPIEMYEFMDNDMHDENPADGVFAFTYTDEMAEGINYLADDLLFVTFNSMDYVSVPVKFYSEPTPFSISGYTYSSAEMIPTGGIVVWGQYEWSDDGPQIIVVSDADGYYNLDLPDSGMVMVGTEDYFGMTPGYFAEPSYHLVSVMGHESNYDFYYNEPTSGVEGYVRDENGNPVADVQVRAQHDGPGHSSFTDESGYYYIGLNPGGYDIEVEWSSLSQPYVIPFGQWIEVGDFAPANLNITLQSANSSISGHVYLDQAPFAHAEVYGQLNNMGWTMTMSDDQGAYVLPVHDGGGSFYDLFVWNGNNQSIIQVSQNWGIEAGTTGEDILLATVSGGLYGHFIDSSTGMYISGDQGVGMMLRDLNSGMEYYGGPDGDGYYEIHVPSGLYELQAGGMYYQFDYPPDTLEIGDVLMPYDIVLTPFSFNASLEGTVRNMDGTPIPFANVQIGNDGWGTGMTTGPDGYYYFDLPAGHYYMYAWAEGHMDLYTEIDIYQGQNYQDLFLTMFQSDGVIHGLVYNSTNGDPIPEANVWAYGNEMSQYAMTESNGEFWFDLPNGVYDIIVEHPGYLSFWGQGYEVNNDTTYLSLPLDMPDGGLEGVVFDDMGYEIYDAQIVIVSLEDSSAFFGNTNDAGYYAIPARNGTYQVFANAPGFDPAEMGTITIDNNWVYMDITLYPHQFATPPEIAFVVDQPWDQGRWVRMQFWPGGTEWGPFMGYSVWRMTNTPMGPIMDFVDYVPNHDFEAYNLVVPTLVDSNAYTSPDQYLTGFVVSGHWDGMGYIDGLPAIGYSVDNIHPGVPEPLMLLYSDDSHVDMQWEPSMDMDFQYFELLRATNPEFTDASVEMTTIPAFSDMDIVVGHTYYYQVFAVDANGNRSAGSNIITTSIVSVDDAQALPSSFGLSQNYPNPFNPTTSIEFAIPEASQVSLEIYNLLGQRVRTLVNGYVPAGYITTQWNGLDQNGNELSSGTYIYRLTTTESNFSKKMVLMK